MEKTKSNAPFTNEVASDVLEHVVHKDVQDERVYNQLLKSVGRVIEDNYPAIHTMETEGYHKLNEIISRHLFDLRADIGFIVQHHQQKDKS